MFCIFWTDDYYHINIIRVMIVLPYDMPLTCCRTPDTLMPYLPQGRLALIKSSSDLFHHDILCVRYIAWNGSDVYMFRLSIGLCIQTIHCTNLIHRAKCYIGTLKVNIIIHNDTWDIRLGYTHQGFTATVDEFADNGFSVSICEYVNPLFIYPIWRCPFREHYLLFVTRNWQHKWKSFAFCVQF